MTDRIARHGRVLALCLIASANQACPFISVHYEGNAVEAPFYESELAERLRPDTIELWPMSAVGPLFNARLFGGIYVDGILYTTIDPYPPGYTGSQDNDVLSYGAAIDKQGLLGIGVKTETRSGIGDSLGEPAAELPFMLPYVSLRCGEEAFLLVWLDQKIPLTETAWCTEPAILSVGPPGAEFYPYHASLISLATAGPILDITVDSAGVGTAVPSNLVLPSDIPRGDIRFADIAAPGVINVVAETDGVWRYAKAGAATLTAALPLAGKAMGTEPVRRKDGKLRIATDRGVFEWDVDDTQSVVTLVETPQPTIQAAWESANGDAAAIARENTPNPLASSLDMPVAAQARVLESDHFVVYDLPITPCVVDADCREIGESRILGLVGGSGAYAVVYEVWSWYRSIYDEDVKGVFAVPLVPPQSAP